MKELQFLGKDRVFVSFNLQFTEWKVDITVTSNDALSLSLSLPPPISHYYEFNNFYLFNVLHSAAVTLLNAQIVWNLTSGSLFKLWSPVFLSHPHIYYTEESSTKPQLFA